MKKYILALDQGTSSSRAILFDQEQNVVGMSQKELTQLFPKEGWVEEDPMEIYSSILQVMTEVLQETGIPSSAISGIGITNQRETTILWDKVTGKPVYNAIVWQCRRTAGIVQDLVEKGYTEHIKKVTGLVPDAYFSATKIKWILDNDRDIRAKAKKGEILFGTVDSWLVWKLTNGAVHVTDYTNASRTMLFDIDSLRWDSVLLEALDIPPLMLPEVKNSSEVYGFTEIEGRKIPIAGIAGDQQAALFGQTCYTKYAAKNTYGTGCFLLMNTLEERLYSTNGLLTTIAIGLKGKVQYALEGSIFTGGSVIQWLRDEMGFLSESKDAEELARTVSDTGGVYLVPAFTGLGAPYWNMYARGCMIGMTRGTKREHIIRAAQEAIAYQSYDLVKAMEEDTGVSIEELHVDGGASRDSFLMQFQADILNRKLCRPSNRETTALGAAYLAGLAVGVWKNTDEIKSLQKEDTFFSPCMEEEKRKKLLKGWHKAVSRSLDWCDG